MKNRLMQSQNVIPFRESCRIFDLSNRAKNTKFNFIMGYNLWPNFVEIYFSFIKERVKLGQISANLWKSIYRWQFKVTRGQKLSIDMKLRKFWKLVSFKFENKFLSQLSRASIFRGHPRSFQVKIGESSFEKQKKMKRMFPRVIS